MSYDIRYSTTFRRSAKALAKRHSSFKNDLSIFVKLLAEDPDIGTPLSNNLFKVRMGISSKGGGKSAGDRIITCVIYRREEVLLAEVYDKGDYSTVDEQQVLKNLRNEGFNL